MTDESVTNSDTTGQTKQIDWGMRVCGNCDSYVLSPNLRVFGAISVCIRCHKNLIEKASRKAQPQLFDDQTSLF